MKAGRLEITKAELEGFRRVLMRAEEDAWKNFDSEQTEADFAMCKMAIDRCEKWEPSDIEEAALKYFKEGGQEALLRLGEAIDLFMEDSK